MSQFGVMFFDEPLAAFRNIHSSLRPGGRLTFACWQSADANPWFFAHALAEFVPPAPPPAPGKSPTGPFTLADPVETRALLEAAGFTRVRRSAHELETDLPASESFDVAQLAFIGVSAEALPDAVDAVSRYMTRFRLDDSTSRFPLAFQTFSALRPASTGRERRH